MPRVSKVALYCSSITTALVSSKFVVLHYKRGTLQGRPVQKPVAAKADIQQDSNLTDIHKLILLGNLQDIKEQKEKDETNFNKQLSRTTTYGYSTLNYAAIFGESEILDYFVKECGKDINQYTKYGEHNLQLAASNNQKEMTQKLLEQYKFDVDQPIASYATTLHDVVANGKQDIAQMLIEKYNSNPNSRNQVGVTPLIATALTNNFQCAELLIKNGAKVDTVTLEGYNALHTAAYHGCWKVVLLLISEGADISTKTNDKLQYNAADCAADGGHFLLNLYLTLQNLIKSLGHSLRKKFMQLQVKNRVYL